MSAAGDGVGVHSTKRIPSALRAALFAGFVGVTWAVIGTATSASAAGPGDLLPGEGSQGAASSIVSTVTARVAQPVTASAGVGLLAISARKFTRP